MASRKGLLSLSSRIPLYSRSRTFHTSHTYRAAAPALWLLKPMTRILAAVGGRIGRSVWKRLSPETRTKARKYLYATGGVCIACSVTYYVTHLEYLTHTQRYRFMMYSREQICEILEQELGTSEDGALILKPLIGDQVILPHTHKHYQKLLPIMKKIRNHNLWCDRMNEISWRLAIVENDEITNAVSLPTGDIIVYTGMIKECRNIDELGLLLSHEMSHIILDHGVEGVSHAGLTSFITLLAVGIIWFIIPSDLLSFVLHGAFSNIVTVLTSNKHSRKLEQEADQFGLLLASKACFNPETAITLWQHLPMYNESDTVLEYFQNHPCNEKRFNYLNALLPYAMRLYSSTECEEMRKEMNSFTKTILRAFKLT